MKKLMTVLELMVNNHPGVMSHICGLFSRRAYNLESIVCLPIVTGEDTAQRGKSRMWLQLNEDMKLEQIIKQVNKLEDVLSVTRHDRGHEVFMGLKSYASERDL